MIVACGWFIGQHCCIESLVDSEYIWSTSLANEKFGTVEDILVQLAPNLIEVCHDNSEVYILLCQTH